VNQETEIYARLMAQMTAQGGAVVGEPSVQGISENLGLE
jgi:hypothetical protein